MPNINREGINIHHEVHGSGPPLPFLDELDASAAKRVAR
jgi:hypothetical protein